ncbi:MAG: hypothetical protein H6Q48_560 [Deltaproteobacteria bacterium]|nr:hypothetical protein [Deltaproteobacteria bacterium]
MDHGLTQYEARERLLWFLFLLVCLLMAFPAMWIHLAGVPRTPVIATTSEALKSYAYWSQRHWMHVGPLGKVLAYLAWVAILFIVARFLWLIAQFIGKSSLIRTLDEVVSSLKSRQAAKPWDSSTDVQKKPFAGFTQLIANLNHPLRFVLHAYRRAQYTLAAAPGMPFTDRLLERQQRLSDMDRQIFKSSWTAFRWILRLLPILAALQSFWLIYAETQLFLGKQSELEQFANAFWPAMLPLVQLTLLAVLLGLACAFLNRVEGLYLANLDASLYDQMLSELPIRSSDTLLILESLQKHFRELQGALKRLELELKNKG